MSAANKLIDNLLSEIALNDEHYVALLRNLISVAEKVQNAPSLGLIPQENYVSDFVLEALAPYTKENGGPLEVERVAFVEGRGNVVIKYPGSGDKSIAFVGSHMDVVPANPEGWDRDPFTLSVEGDKLYGRGTTDCLGHVALVTELFIELAKSKIKPSRTIAAVLIASEENAEIPGVGVDKLMESGKMDFIRGGPVIWVDCADSEPCVGTAGVLTWTLKATGKLFHSGLPHNGINALELGMDAMKYVQERFYKDFPQHKDEGPYNFACGSTMKPTQVEGSVNSVNQIPPWFKISGDVRLSPFYDVHDLKAKLQSYVQDLNNDITCLECRGPHSKYTLPAENKNGLIEITFGESHMEGIACSLDSEGYHALVNATKKIKGSVKPYAIMGSLPLVRDLQRGGFDVQLIGFGKSSVYHGDNEYCLLSDMKDAVKILAEIIRSLEVSS